MIRGVLLASVALHVAMIAVLPDARPAGVRAPDAPSLVEVTSEPPKKEEPPVSSPTPSAAAPVKLTAAVVRTSPTAPAATGRTTAETPATRAVDGDGPADFTASVISNVPSGPASKILVTASPPKEPTGPKIVPVSSLSRRPGAPGLDAELERNYPVEARRAGISGTAKLRVQILPDGRVSRVERVSESYAGFGDACARTVRAARWEPPLDADGRAVATEIVYVCKFEVRS